MFIFYGVKQCRNFEGEPHKLVFYVYEFRLFFAALIPSLEKILILLVIETHRKKSTREKKARIVN